MFAPSTLRRWIQAATLATGVGTLGTVVWSVAPIGSVTPIASAPKKSTPLQLQRPLPSADWNALTATSLRGGFVGAVVTMPPDQGVPVVSNNAASDLWLIRLIGTIMEDGRDLAIAVDRNGRVAYEQVGGEFELQPSGITVDRIDSSEVLVRYLGESVTLRVGETFSPSSMPTLEATQSAGTVSPVSLDSAEPNETTVVPTIPSMPVEEIPSMDLDSELEFLNGG